MTAGLWVLIGVFAIWGTWDWRWAVTLTVFTVIADIILVISVFSDPSPEEMFG